MHAQSAIMAIKQKEPPLTVTASDATVDNIRGSSPCYAGVEINSNNTIYRGDNVGVYTTAINSGYVTNGSTSDVWMERTINSQSSALWQDGIGSGRLQCSNSATLEMRDTNSGVSAETANITVSWYDASSGGNLLDTATYDLSANYDIA